MSQRGIAGVLGVGVGTVHRDLESVPNGTPERVDANENDVCEHDAVPNGTPHKPHLSQNTGNDEWYGKLGNTSHQG